jgi:hypothetical protein
MNLDEQLNMALDKVGYPPLPTKNSYQKIGSGAWHDAYLVETVPGEPIVIRIRKKVIYGQLEVFEERKLSSSYAAVGLYYSQANQCYPGICPKFYKFHIDPALTFTLESYLGHSLLLSEYELSQAFKYGQTLGHFFRILHALPQKISGFGYLVWNGETFSGTIQKPLQEIWREGTEYYLTGFERLSHSSLSFDRISVERKLQEILESRTVVGEPVSLVNQDISPEHLIVRSKKLVSIIDPIPLLNNGTKYAGLFLGSYKFFHIANHDNPRYASHKFIKYAPVLNAIADGFLDGYVESEMGALKEALKEKLWMEYFLWLLSFAFHLHLTLESQISKSTLLRMGSKTAIARRLQRTIQELERFPIN